MNDTPYMELLLHSVIHMVLDMFRPVMLCNFWICKRCQSLFSKCRDEDALNSDWLDDSDESRL